MLRNLDQRVGRIEQILPTLATRAELREESERTRRHFDIVAERLRDDIRLLDEGQASLAVQFQELRIEVTEVKNEIGRRDARFTRFEASR